MANDDCKAGSRLSQRKTRRKTQRKAAQSATSPTFDALISDPQQVLDSLFVRGISQQLMSVEDQLNELYACQQFFNQALYQLSSSEDLPTPLQFGAHLNGYWLQEKTQAALAGLTVLQQQLRDVLGRNSGDSMSVNRS